MSATALYTGLTGLQAHSRRIEVIGNNIANVNTTAFKASRLNFETQLSRTVSVGTEPGDTTGGVNPMQIGLGVSAGSAVRDTTQGSLTATGDARDLAIDGAGYFVVQRDTERLYTRDGSFRLDADQTLVNPDGLSVLGYVADESFVITEGTLSEITVPINGLTIAEATTEVHLAGNLNADGALATGGSTLTLVGSEGEGLTVLDGASVPPTEPNIIEATSLLVELEDPTDPGSGVALFQAGQTLRLDGATRGGATIPAREFQIAADSTVQDLLDFLNDALGLHAVDGGNPDGSSPGVALDPETGTITVTGNVGSVNDLEVEAGDLLLLDADGATIARPFAVEKSASAAGESVRTSFVVYDSLGSEVVVRAAFALESRSDEGTTWRYFIDSDQDTDESGAIATGTVSFDTSGRLLTTDPITVSVDLDGSGAETPLAFSLSLSSGTEAVTALADTSSSVASVWRDGAPIGVLQGYAVGSDGTVTGQFSNGAVRSLARLAIATFANDAGLVEAGSNLFDEGANSGQAVLGRAGTQGAGLVVSGSLEASNVDLGREFIDMILTSTGYSASSRVVRTADELMQQLLVLGR